MEKRMFCVKELAHYIGLAPQTIKNQFYAGRFPIPPTRLGRKLLWDKKNCGQISGQTSEDGLFTASGTAVILTS